MQLPDPDSASVTNPLERLEPFLRLDPGNPLLLAEAADVALAGGSFERAQRLIDTGLALPNDPSIWRFRQSSLYIAQRRLDEAQGILSALLQQGEAAGVASLVALDMGDMEAVLDLSQQALEADIPPMEALVARASVALAQRDAPCVRELLEAGLKLNPKEGRAWSTLGFTAMLEQQLGQAQQLFGKGTALARRRAGSVPAAHPALSGQVQAAGRIIGGAAAA